MAAQGKTARRMGAAPTAVSQPQFKAEPVAMAVPPIRMMARGFVNQGGKDSLLMALSKVISDHLSFAG
jgi:hypothetical protein